MPNTLIHAPLTCSLAVRIAAAEGAVPIDINYVDLTTKKLENGGSLYEINPLGQVSVLRLTSGEIITETSTILLWIQSQSRNTQFCRTPQNPDYFQMVRWINFCATELHKQIFRIVFYPEATDQVKERIRALAPQRFELLDNHLFHRAFLIGDTFSAADAYLTWFFVLAEKAKLDYSKYNNLLDYSQHMLARPIVRKLIASDTHKREEQYQ